MNPVEAYLLELRAALGDRLPPSVHEARLREACAHLLASAEEVGAKEAVRRYGRPRAVATDLVRVHRGYDAKSAWRLAVPFGAAFYTAGMVGALSGRFVHRGSEVNDFVLQAILPTIALGFVVRAFQARRWLAAPMFLWHAAGILTWRLFLLLALGRGTGSASDCARLGQSLAILAAAWFSLNAIALGLSRLLDLRRAHLAGSGR